MLASCWASTLETLVLVPGVSDAGREKVTAFVMLNSFFNLVKIILLSHHPYFC